MNCLLQLLTQSSSRVSPAAESDICVPSYRRRKHLSLIRKWIFFRYTHRNVEDDPTTRTFVCLSASFRECTEIKWMIRMWISPLFLLSIYGCQNTHLCINFKHDLSPFSLSCYRANLERQHKLFQKLNVFFSSYIQIKTYVIY